ncbi:MAG: hypothetical protein V9G18_12610 [Albidovulum sp.]
MFLHPSIVRMIPFLAEYEGKYREMYLDVNGDVTTGVGFLLGSENATTKYKWEKISSSGEEAGSIKEAAKDEWKKLRSLRNNPTIKVEYLKGQAWSFIRFGRKLDVNWKGKKQKLITLKLAIGEIERSMPILAEEHVRDLIVSSNEYFNDFYSFPADAQLGIITVIWANGPMYLHKPKRNGKDGFPTFCRLCMERSWGDIADKKEYRWKAMPRGRGRDLALYRLFKNAANLDAAKNAGINVNINILHYPLEVENLAEAHNRISKISMKEKEQSFDPFKRLKDIHINLK